MKCLESQEEFTHSEVEELECIKDYIANYEETGYDDEEEWQVPSNTGKKRQSGKVARKGKGKVKAGANKGTDRLSKGVARKGKVKDKGAGANNVTDRQSKGGGVAGKGGSVVGVDKGSVVGEDESNTETDLKTVRECILVVDNLLLFDNIFVLNNILFCILFRVQVSVGEQILGSVWALIRVQGELKVQAQLV